MINKKKTTISILVLGFAVCYNEYFVYRVVLSQCQWPLKYDGLKVIRAMLLTDVHLIGPDDGNWFERLRVEAQMKRVYQNALAIHQPDVVFMLGDLFDEGQYVGDEYFNEYLERLHEIFKTPPHIPRYCLVGNHDIGFHYRLNPNISDRFKEAFPESDNSLITIKESHFVLLNSVTLYRDSCGFCAKTEADIEHMAMRLNCAKHKWNTSTCRGVKDKLPFYARPILIQHYPTYRSDDRVCLEHDYIELEEFKESREVLSKNATEFVGENLYPAVSFCGHSHHYCRSINMWGGEEYTVASFSWQHKSNPSFLLTEFAGDNYAVSKCDMPKQSTVIFIYAMGLLAVGLIVMYPKIKSNLRSKYHPIYAKCFSHGSNDKRYSIL